MMQRRTTFITTKCLQEASKFYSSSSNIWMERQKKDIYVKMSRYENYRARSAFKLKQLDDKYKFLRPGLLVIDVGAAPGSWTQVVCERLKLVKNDEHKAGIEPISGPRPGMCIAIDIQPIAPVDGAICISNADFTSPFTQAKLISWLNKSKLDVILSDMAPSSSGNRGHDHQNIIKLNYKLISFAHQVLKPPTGWLITKIWDGNETFNLRKDLELLFKNVFIHKPLASRSDSSESYIICNGFKK